MGRGKDLTTEDILTIKAAYAVARQSLGPHATIGAGKVMENLGDKCKKTSATKVLMALKAGAPAEDMSKKRTREATKATAAADSKAKDMSRKSNSTAKRPSPRNRQGGRNQESGGARNNPR